MTAEGGEGRCPKKTTTVILQKKCDCVDEISNTYSRFFRINFVTGSIFNATDLRPTFCVSFGIRGLTDSESH